MPLDDEIDDREEDIIKNFESQAETLKKDAPAINLDEPGEEIEVGAEIESDGPEARETRAEKKRNRFREANERAEAAERRAEEAVRRVQDLERRTAQVAPAPASPQPASDDLEQVYAYQRQVAASYQAEAAASGNRLSAERQRYYEQEASRIEEAKLNAVLDRRLRDPNSPMNPAVQARRATEAQVAQHIRTAYPEVVGREDVFQWADVEYRVLQRNGAPDSMETLNKAMKAAVHHFKLRAPSEDVSDERKARYTNSSTQGSSPAMKPGQKRSIEMAPEFKKMADMAYGHIKDPKVRYQKWANEVGPEVLRLKSKKSA